MLEAFKQTNLTDGSGRNTVVFFLESDFLQSDNFASLKVSALVHDTICAFSKFLLALVTLQLGGCLDEALGLWLLLGAHLSSHVFSSWFHIDCCGLTKCKLLICVPPIHSLGVLGVWGDRKGFV